MVKKTRKSLIHLKSSVSGKIPTAEQLNYGEIAINYAKDSEAIFFKNSENNVVEVKTNSAVVEELNTKQDKTDNALATTAKTVTGAINEINTKVSNIPTVNDPKVSIKMNGVEKGSFTLNQASAGEVDLGTVLTEHQSLKTINGETITGSGDISVKGDTVKCRIDQSTMVSGGDGTQENPYVFKMSLEDVKKYKDCDFVEIYDSSSNTSVYSFYRTMTGIFYTPFIPDVYSGCLAGAFIGDESPTAEQIGFAFYSLHISDEVESGGTALVSSRAVYYALQAKQDKLTSGTNIKTINSQSLLGSGDITIKSESDVVKCRINITSQTKNENNSIFYKLPLADVLKYKEKCDIVEIYGELENGSIEVQFELFRTYTGYFCSPLMPGGGDGMAFGAFNGNSSTTDENEIGFNFISFSFADVPLESNNGSLIASGTVYTALQAKQDKLTSGTNIKTINNQSILGSGNVDISAPIYVVPMIMSTDGYPIPDSSKIDTNKLSVYMKSGYTVIGKPVDSSAPIVSFITGNNGYHYHYFDEKKGMMVIRVYGNNLSQHEIEYNYQFAAPQDSGSTGVCGGVPVPTYDDKEKFLKGDGTWSEVKTIDGESLIGSGDIKIKNNDYYLPVSAFSGQTAVTQDVLDAIVDVRNSQGRKHLYIYDESKTKGAVAEASVANYAGEWRYFVSWMAHYGFARNTIWVYLIEPSTKAVTDQSFSLEKFIGATTSASGREGIIPAPTTADTKSFLCGNGKWEKVSGGSSAFNVGPLINDGSGKITEANYNALKQHIQNGDALYYAHSDESETWTTNVSATIVSGGTTAETICLFLDDSMSVSGWDPSKALSSFHTTYTANMGMIYQIKKSDLSADLGGYIYHQPMLQNGVNIKKINGQDLILGTPDMNGEANLEIASTFPLDPNNFKFSELVEATLSYKTIVLKNFLYFSYSQSLAAMPLTADGAEATTVSDTKSVYCTFMYLNTMNNKPYANTFGIKFTGDNKWEEVPNTSGPLMYNSDYKVDTSMSDTSTNPVQNKVIKAYIDELVGNLTAQLAQI